MTLTKNSILENRYRIEKKLGQGGFGAVYQATKSCLYAPCAILSTASGCFLKKGKHYDPIA